MDRVIVPPELVRWARRKSGLTVNEASARWPKFDDWESGRSAPTMRQLEQFAKRTHSWLGFFFLPWTPSDDLEIADFRGPSGAPSVSPSPEMLEAVHLSRLRQQWYREQALLLRRRPLKFVASKRPNDSVIDVAQAIRETLRIMPRGCSDPEDALEALESVIGQAEAAGIVVTRGGSVPSAIAPGTEDPEFRGLALSDSHAPLVYLDASDAVASQIFTLVHELAHLWVGTSGVSNPKETLVADAQPIEIFCNRVAAETLVPLSDFKEAWNQALPLEEQCQRLSEKFCVSPLIVLRRAYDATFLDSATFHSAYHAAVERTDRVSQIKAAGRKPLTALQRVGKNLGEMLAAAVQAHRIDEHEAMALLAAATPEEVWSVCGSHDKCTEEEAIGQDARYAHLAATA